MSSGVGVQSRSVERPEVRDEQVRAEVVRELESFLVEAPAGSGKTELLIQRYLRVLAEVDEPDQVLAVTFTRKAAAQMRHRVFRALAQAAKGEDSATRSPHQQRTHEWAARVAARDRERGWGLTENPGRLEIRTIDSFCDSLVSRAPLAGGLGRTQRAVDDAEELFQEAARRTLRLLAGDDAVAEAVATLLRRLDNNLPRFERLMLDMLMRREQWMRLFGDHLDADTDPESARKELETSAADAVKFELQRLRAGLSDAIVAPDRAQLLAAIRYGASRVPPNSTVRVLAALEDWPEADAAEISVWRELRDFLFTQKDETRKKFDKTNGFLPGDDRRERDGLVALLRRLDASPAHLALKGIARRLRKLPDARYSQSEWELLRALFVVLPRAVEELRAVFVERDRVDHSEVAQSAQRTLGGRGKPSAMARHVSGHLRHVLMDEFQDTSYGQVELLRQLTCSWSGQDGRTLFLVGDPMQSIYSFRQAEVTLFGEVARSGIQRVALKRRGIELNFRSQPALVEWCNRAFAQVMTHDDALTGAVPHRAAAAALAAVDVDGAACEVHEFPFARPDLEAQFIAETAKRELEQSSDARVAILVRARTHLPAIVDALHRAGVAFRARDIDPLEARPAVRDLLALTRALLHLGDRIAWLGALRAPWCGLTLADLWELCRGDERTSVWTLLRQRAGGLTSDGQQRVTRFLSLVEPILAERGRSSLRQWVESAWITLAGPAVARKDQAEADLTDAAAFLDLLDTSETAGELLDMRRFSAQLEILYAPAAGTDVRLEIMTIHLAKGLEFDAVIVPALERFDRNADPQLVRWYRRVLNDRFDLLLAPIAGFPRRNVRPEDGTLEAYLKVLEEDCSREEDKRLLYVAATRARRKLYLTYTQPGADPEARARRGSLLDLANSADAFRAARTIHTDAATDTKAADAAPAFRRLPSSVAWPMKPQPLAWREVLPSPDDTAERHTFEWVDQTMRHAGTVAHRMLQQIAREGVERWNSATASDSIAARSNAIRAALLSEGVAASQLTDAAAIVEEALRNTLADERGRWLVASHERAASELELSAEIGGALRRVKLDRTFLDSDGTRWIADFKITRIQGGSQDAFLAEQCAKYRPDLERYRSVLTMRGESNIKLGLYFPLQRAWREL